MNLIYIAAGLIIGLFDIIPMIIKKLDPLFTASAFTMWLAAGILAGKLELSGIPAVNGLLCALLVFLPLSFLIYRLDRGAMIQICLSTVILGLLLGAVPALIIS